MKSRLILVVFALAGLIAWGGALGFTEDEKPKPMSEQEMWAKSMELAKPGEMHKLLDMFCGHWKISGQMFSSAGAMPFQGETKNEWVLGGRFIESKYEGPGMMGKMEGRGLMGYDNGKKVFQQTWAMTMGTGISLSTGTYDAEKKTFTFMSKTLGPDGVTYKTREVIVVKSNDGYSSTSYATAEREGAKEVKELEMTHTRVTAK